jgi:hypothetical protein
MLDVLLIPAALLLVLALVAVRRGEHRLHGHLMTALFTLVGLRLLLHPRGLNPGHRALWLATLGAAGLTILLGRGALAWREARGTHPSLPRIHRMAGRTTIVGLALSTLVWLLRHRG